MPSSYALCKAFMHPFWGVKAWCRTWAYKIHPRASFHKNFWHLEYLFWQLEWRRHNRLLFHGCVYFIFHILLWKICAYCSSDAFFMSKNKPVEAVSFPSPSAFSNFCCKVRLSRNTWYIYLYINTNTHTHTYLHISDVHVYLHQKADDSYRYGNGFTFTQYYDGNTWQSLDYYRQKRGWTSNY